MGDKTKGYPILLKWDLGPEKLKELKKKLHTYFQSSKKSDGGECEIPDTDCSRGYILIQFKEEAVQQRVFQKDSHQILLQDGSTLPLFVSLPGAVTAQRMGNLLSSSEPKNEDGASGSSFDTDRQEENSQSPDNRKRKNSSMTDPDAGNGDSKRLGDDSTGFREWESGIGGVERKEHNINSSAPGSLTENYKYNSPRDSSTSRTWSRGNSLGRHLSKEEPGKNRHAAPPEDDGAPGSLADADYQQGNNQNTDSWKRRSPSLTDPGSMDGYYKRPEGDLTRHRKWENRSDFGGIDGKEQDINSSAPKSLTEDDISKSYEDSFTSRIEENSLRHMSTEEPRKNRRAPSPEIFSKVIARLDKTRFTKTLEEQIKAEIPSLSVKYESNFVEVMGKFKEIQLVHSYLQGKLEPELGAEKPPETPSAWSPTDSQADQVCFPSALYEYIMEIYRTEIDKLERTYGVKIDHHSTQEGSTYVRFITHGSDSLPEKAKEIFTDKVQKVMDDWNQVTVDPSVVPLTISEIKERVADRWSHTQVIQGENKDIILRGPRDELSQVKMFLEKVEHKPEHKPTRPPRAVTISTSNMRTEIEVDARHMDILKKLKHREISEIEKKYNVKIEEHTKNVSSLVTFKSMNAAPDLSPHASHSFITLLQKTFFNIEKKEISVKPEFQEERVSIVQEQLMMAGIDIVMEYSKGTVLLIGHPVHVAFAEEKLSGSQNPGKGQAAVASVEKMDTSSPSAAAQKAEEPDTCPICLCEMEDKVLLEKCKHAFCRGCLKKAMAHKPVCAICGVSYGTVTGDQPDGTMKETKHRFSLLGYPNCGTIEIKYNIPSGTQKENHPHPGRHFSGAQRTAYLPDNKEGNDILRLLKKAFNQKLIFTVGDSRTTGATDIVTWNDIHHKTNTTGGPQNFGYPDPDYLNRVRDELKAKGVE